MTSNVHLGAGTGLYYFCWVVDWLHTKQLQKVVKLSCIEHEVYIQGHNNKIISS